MFSFFAVVIYLAALCLPIYVLFQFGSQAWYWHAMAVLGALALGLIPMPLWLQSQALDLALGFAFVALIVWGAGGLILFRTHHEKRA